MKVTEAFRERVQTHWQSPGQVAWEAMDELFRHNEELSLDHDDQVKYALRIGILVGETKKENPESFIDRFEKEILNEE